MSSQAVSSGLQIEITLNSAFASRKRHVEEEKKGQFIMTPSHFQVYTKIDEESRKDNKLVISFLLTLNDTKGMVTYEFRGICSMSGTSADFESMMETSKNSRVPKILDVLYQKLYPVVFILAGMTTSSYPQSVALMTDMVSSEPIQVKQQVVAVAEGGHETKTEPSPPSITKESRMPASRVPITRSEANATPAVKDAETPASRVTVPKFSPPKIARPKIESRASTPEASKHGTDKHS